MAKRLVFASLLLASSTTAWAAQGKVLINVQNPQNQPVGRVQIGVSGAGGTATTGDDGKAQIAVSGATRPSDPISLTILHSPPGKDYVLLSPWDSRALVPPFDDKPDSFIRVVIMSRGDKLVLEKGSVITSLAAQINKANMPKAADRKQVPSDPWTNVQAVAKHYGFAPEEVDRAIRELGDKTNDKYQAALVDLYENNLDKASALLQDTRKQLEAEVAATENLLANKKMELFNTRFFLGQTHYQQGRYHEAVDDFTYCLQTDPNNAVVIGDLGASLSAAGDYAAAEPLIRQALVLDEEAPVPDYKQIVTDITNLVVIRFAKSDLVEVDSLLHKALDVCEKHFLPDDPTLAQVLFQLGLLSEIRADFSAAESSFHRALEIDKKTYGPDDIQIATDNMMLSALLTSRGKLAEAVTVDQRTVDIYVRQLGPDHPLVAAAIGNMGRDEMTWGNVREAERLLKKAIAAYDKSLGLDNPTTLSDQRSLGELFAGIGDYKDAEQLFQRAQAVDEKTTGPGTIFEAMDLKDMGDLQLARSDYASAEHSLRQASAIVEKLFGLEYVGDADILTDLGETLRENGDYRSAEPILNRALAIQEKSFSPDQEYYMSETLTNLAAVLRLKGDLTSPEPLLRRALAAQEKAYLQNTCYQLGELLKVKGEIENARSFYKCALDIDRKSLLPDHYKTKRVAQALASLQPQSKAIHAN
jgi:tetratricopeptide (TPR) repeat protein